MVRAITNPAPALIPRIPESASGFLVNVCNSNPAIPKEAPPKIQTIIRGKRMLVMIKRKASSDFPLISFKTLITEVLA